MSSIRRIALTSAANSLAHPLAPVIASMAFNMWRLGRASLWADEGATFGIALYGLFPYEHPVTYFRFMAFWMKIAGHSEFMLRLPSVLAIAGFVALVYRAGVLIRGKQLGTWAAWLAVFSPFARLGAQEARMYALLALTGSLALVGLLWWMAGKKKGAYVWGIGAAGSMLLHHLGWLAVWPPWLMALGVSRRRRDLLLAAFGALILYVPILSTTITQIWLRVTGEHLGTSASLMAIMKKLLGQVYYMGAGYVFTQLDLASLLHLARRPGGLIFWLQLSIPLFFAVQGARYLRPWRDTRLLLGLLFTVPTFLFLGYEGSPANLVLPVYLPYLLLLASGVLSTPRFRFVVPLLWALTVVVQSRSPTYPIHPEDWRSLTVHIRANATSKDAVFLTGSRNSVFVTDYYSVSPALRYALVDSSMIRSSVDPHVATTRQSVVSPVRTILDKHESVWFVYIDYDLPFMQHSVDSLWQEAGVTRRKFGDGLELLHLRERGGV